MNLVNLLIVLLAIFGPAIGSIAKKIAERQQEAEARRRGTQPGSPGHRTATALDRSAAPTQDRSPSTAQSELAAQRQAQIEMWKARQAAMGGSMQRTSPAGAEEELARRRRLAMEELRRRQVAEDLRRSSQTTPGSRVQPVPVGPTSRRARPSTDAQRRAQSSHRRSSVAPVEAPALAAARSAIIGDLVEATAAHPQPEPTAVPASRTSPAGSLNLSATSLRQAFIMKELLDPPLALRDTSAGSGAGYDQPI